MVRATRPAPKVAAWTPAQVVDQMRRDAWTSGADVVQAMIDEAAKAEALRVAVSDWVARFGFRNVSPECRRVMEALDAWKESTMASPFPLANWGDPTPEQVATMLDAIGKPRSAKVVRDLIAAHEKAACDPVPEAKAVDRVTMTPDVVVDRLIRHGFRASAGVVFDLVAALRPFATMGQASGFDAVGPDEVLASFGNSADRRKVTGRDFQTAAKLLKDVPTAPDPD